MAVISEHLEGPHVGADERGCLVATGLEHFGECCELLRNQVAAVVSDAVVRRIGAGKKRRVRRQRHRRRCVGASKENAVARHGIDGGRLYLLEPVGSQAVGARRVEGDDENVERLAVAQLREVQRSRRKNKPECRHDDRGQRDGNRDQD